MACCNEPAGMVSPSLWCGLRCRSSKGGSWLLARAAWRSRMRSSTSGLQEGPLCVGGVLVRGQAVGHGERHAACAAAVC